MGACKGGGGGGGTSLVAQVSIGPSMKLYLMRIFMKLKIESGPVGNGTGVLELMCCQAAHGATVGSPP